VNEKHLIDFLGTFDEVYCCRNFANDYNTLLCYVSQTIRGA